MQSRLIHSIIKNSLFKKNITLFCIIVCSSLTACVTTQLNQATLQNQIDTITAASGTHAVRGIAIQSLQTGQIVYVKNFNLPFVPASNMKLFTAAAALIYLGPAYQYHTTIYRNNNDIYMKYTGDPDLTAQQVKNLIRQLKQSGISRIKGNFYIDNSQYDNYDIAPGWMWDDLKYCYAAPVDAVMINHNCIVPLNSTIDDNDPAIQFPYHTATTLIYQSLQQNHIFLQGKILSGTVDRQAKIIADQVSQPLSALVTQMLKNSDNLIANSLLKTLGSTYFKQAGNWDNGVLAMQTILNQRYHINFSQAKIVDGSGLSRYDLITPQQTLQLLNYVYHDQAIAIYFINALPIAGYDGTLKNRMLSRNIMGRVHAKTGTMGGVSSLSGYAYTNNNQVYAFVIFMNNFVGKVKSQTNIEDEIVSILVN